MLKLDKVKKIYVIGIKGQGIVAVVQILASMDIDIVGSDTDEKFSTDDVLQKLGIHYFEKFSIDNIPPDADLILYSTAYSAENNIEFAEAEKRQMMMVSYPEMLAELFNQKYGIAVCGTHGKTTTSSMLAYALNQVGVFPTAVIGSRICQWGTNALVGNGEYFVIEADEYQNKLQLYEPNAVILTSVDYDHPDFFKTFEDYKNVFADFVAKIPKIGFLAVWGDSVDTIKIADFCQGDIITYGFSDDNDVVIKNHSFIGVQQKFEVLFFDRSLGFFEIKLPGKHNVLNATAVIATCQKMNVDIEKVREALIYFEGTSRRFEMIGQCNGAILIDDYAHHPEEIKVMLKATREIYPDKNITAVFHPHSYSRTEALLQDFAQSFDSVDKVIVLDIYGSARENSGTVTSLDLVKLINRYNRDKAEYIPTIDEAVEFLQDKIAGNDVVITIGAGNVFEIANKLKQ